MQNICYIIGAYHGEAAVIRPAAGDFVIAADGGYKALQTLGVKADLVVGDFDSLGYVPAAEEVVQHPVRKDDTDTLLAIRLGLERGYKHFVITGAIGGRLDHTFANLQALLFLRDHGARGVLYGDGTVVTAVTNSSVAIEGKGVFSVFAVDPIGRGVALRNVSFPLENAELANSFPLGTSNEFLDGPATISISEGTLLVMWQAEQAELPEIIVTL